MSKHTPGLWTVVNTKVMAESGSIEVASVSDYVTTTPRQAANARLIAAAPELLDALRAINDRTVRIDGRFAELAIDRFRAIASAAIWKATGESA